MPLSNRTGEKIKLQMTKFKCLKESSRVIAWLPARLARAQPGSWNSCRPGNSAILICLPVVRLLRRFVTSPQWHHTIETFQSATCNSSLQNSTTGSHLLHRNLNLQSAIRNLKCEELTCKKSRRVAHPMCFHCGMNYSPKEVKKNDKLYIFFQPGSIGTLVYASFPFRTMMLK